MGKAIFNEMEIDAIGEIMNISLGASATAVSNLLGTPTNITTPVVKIEGGSKFSFQDLEPAVAVEISYVEGLSGKNVMMFSRDDVRTIVGMMMGQEIPPEEFELDEMNKSAICEVMNQMMGSSATALSEFLGYTVNISTPVSFEVPNADAFKEKYFPKGEQRVVVRFNLEIKDKVNSEFLIIMDVKLVKKLLEPYAQSLGVADDADENVNPAEDAAATENSTAEDVGADDKAAAAETAADTNANAAVAAEPKKTKKTSAKKTSRKKADKAAKADTDAEASVEEVKQADTDAEAPAEETKQPEAEMSDEEAEQRYMEMTSGGRPLNQNETDRILAKLREENADSADNASEAADSTEATADAMPTTQTVQPAQTTQSVQQPRTEQQAVQPAQPMQAAPAAPDPALTQILAAMQQSQNQMMNLISEIHEERKERDEQISRAEAARQEQARAAAQQPRDPSVVRSMNPPEYTDLPQGGEELDANREMLMKVPVEISVEIGRTRKPIKDILDLTQGSLVVLDKMAGEQADLYVNGECIAHGDIVVVEDNFGIRITEILNKEVYKEATTS